eukprot:46851-Prymnesium_polylepis.1
MILAHSARGAQRHRAGNMRRDLLSRRSSVHAGTYAPDGSVAKDSKSEILFAAARPHMHADPATFDGADLSDVQIPGERFMSI